MPSIELRAIVASAIHRGRTEYGASKFGPRSLDEDAFGDGKVTLRDRFINASGFYSIEELRPDRAESALLGDEIDRLYVASIALDVRAIREAAEEGRGWRSTLDFRPGFGVPSLKSGALAE